MKRTSLALAALLLISCGSSNSKNINGYWFSSLTNANGTTSNDFRASLAQGMGSAVSVSGFYFVIATPCFSTMAESATFTTNGSAGGYQTGAFQMTITTIFPASQNNVLTLNGTRDGQGNISGTWTATGEAGCTGNGMFNMRPQPPVDPPL